MTWLLSFVVLALPVVLQGQVVESINGKFYVIADDSAVLFINGKEVARADFKGEKKVKESVPLDVRIGDRLVVHLFNRGGPRGLTLQFVSSDSKHLFNFPRSAFKKLENPTAADFSLASFREARSVQAEKHPGGPKMLPFKSRSEWVWGEAEICAIGAVLTRDMLSKVTP